MTQCIKCGGALTRRRNCKHCGPQPPTHVTKMKHLINLRYEPQLETPIVGLIESELPHD